MKYLLFLLSITLLFACRNDDGPDCPTPKESDASCYESWLESIENPVQKDLINPRSVVGPFIYFLDRYEYKYSCFNPNDPCEIAYIRNELGVPSFGELFVFNFKDGTKRKLSDSVYTFSQIDWSSRDWIVFHGAGDNLWKIKSSGDSLGILVSSPGSQANPRWSPDGMKLLSIWSIYDLEGNFIDRLNEKVYVFGWIDDETVFGSHSEETEGIGSYNIQNHTWASLIPHVRLESSTFFKRDAMQVFENKTLDNGDKTLLRYDMISVHIDSVRKIWFSHQYGRGNYHPKTERALANLIRYDWKDSIFNQIYYRQHLVMLDKDGNELGVVKIPE